MTRFQLGAPWYVVAGFIVVGLAVGATLSVRVGGYIMAAAMVMGAGMRAFLPERYVADIRVRARVTDIAVYLALAALLVVATGLVRA